MTTFITWLSHAGLWSTGTDDDNLLLRDHARDMIVMMIGSLQFDNNFMMRSHSTALKLLRTTVSTDSALRDYQRHISLSTCSAFVPLSNYLKGSPSLTFNKIAHLVWLAPLKKKQKKHPRMHTRTHTERVPLSWGKCTSQVLSQSLSKSYDED